MNITFFAAVTCESPRGQAGAAVSMFSGRTPKVTHGVPIKKYEYTENRRRDSVEVHRLVRDC